MSEQNFKLTKHFAEGNALDVQRTRASYEHATKNDLPLLYRYVVLETIFDPTIIDNNKLSYFQHSLRVANMHFAKVLPRNTIIGRRISSPGVAAVSTSLFLFPLLPPSISLPCKPGEHVWVMFENQAGTSNDLGYWMCRIVEPGFVDDVNHTHAPRSLDPSFTPGIKDQFEGSTEPVYELRNGRADERDGQRYTIAETALIPGAENTYEKLSSDTDGGKTVIKEAVPRYRKRPGDTALEGSNNSLIVLGTDRNGEVAQYEIDASGMKVALGFPEKDDQDPGTAMIDLVVGRGQTEKTSGKKVDVKSISGHKLNHKELGKSAKELVKNEGDPDLINDRSRILISQRTKVDKNFGIDTFNAKLSTGPIQGVSSDQTKKNVKDSEKGDGAVVIKSDKIRLISRTDIELLVTSNVERDVNGNLVSSTNEDDFAVLVIKANGDIVLRPAKKGYIKLGGDDADKGLVCSDLPATGVDGIVTGAPLTTTMGGLFAGSKLEGSDKNGPALAPGQAKFASKILVK
jgi:hypothetical protein